MNGIGTTPSSWNAPETSGSKPRSRNLVVVVVLHGLLTVGALHGALSWAWGPYFLYRPRWYLPVCLPIIVLAMKWLADRLSPWTNAPGLPVATSIGAVGASVLLAFSTSSLTWGLVRLLPMCPTLGQESPPTVDQTLWALAIVLTVSTAVAFVPLRAWGRSANVLRRLAAVMAMLLGLLVAMGCVRRWLCPGLDTYLEGLQAASEELSPPGVPDNQAVGGISGVGAKLIPTFRAGVPGERRHNVGDLTIVQACTEKGCRVGLATGRDAPPSPNDVRPDAPLQGWANHLAVARDPLTDAVFVAIAQQVFEFRLVDGQWQSAYVNPERVAARTAVPRLWLMVGLGGMIAIGALAWARRRAARRRQRLMTGKSGILGADGWITFEAGPALRADATLGLLPGPVVVFAPASGAAYRDQQALSGTDILRGTIAEHLERLAFRTLRYDAAIAAIASLASAPLAAAAVVGLVLPLG